MEEVDSIAGFELSQGYFTFYSGLGIELTGSLLDAPGGYYVYRSAPDSPLRDSFQDLQLAIESSSQLLLDAIIEKLFESASNYHFLASISPSWMVDGGFNPELAIDRASFNRLVKSSSSEELFRLFYYRDLEYLVDGFTEACGQAARSMRRAICLLCGIKCDCEMPDGVCRVSSLVSREVLREAESFIIRLYSALDMLSRLLCELKRIPDRFDSIRRIPCDKTTLFAYCRKRSARPDVDDHIFSSYSESYYLEDLRNEIIHNRALENSASCYIRLNGGQVEERYFLLPDSEETGRLMKWNGRCRFYSQERKGNLVLPQIYREVSLRMNKALSCALKELNPTL